MYRDTSSVDCAPSTQLGVNHDLLTYHSPTQNSFYIHQVHCSLGFQSKFHKLYWKLCEWSLIFMWNNHMKSHGIHSEWKGR